MVKDKREIVENIINEVADIVGASVSERQKKIDLFLTIETKDELVDKLLGAFHMSLSSGKLKREDAIRIVDKHMTKLYPEKYPTTDSLQGRLEHLDEVNIIGKDMPLDENHKHLMETFDAINKLLGNKFDYLHTGGLMGYIASNGAPQRFHDDLDVFINEDQLFELKKLIDSHPDFELISGLDEKGETGHEFSIKYKNSPIEIGLFLFERTQNDEIIQKSYYKDDQNNLMVNEKHFPKEYSDLAFPKNNYKMHNGIEYSVQSVEALYLSKKNANRRKDKKDKEVMENIVDLEVVESMDKSNNKTVEKEKIPAQNSIVADLYKSLKQKKQQELGEQ